MGDTKRMIYIREDNVDFYNKLENKSDFVNEAIKTARLGGVENFKTTEIEEGEVVPASNAGDTVDAIAAMRERDAKILKEYREKKGLYDPTK